MHVFVSPQAVIASGRWSNVLSNGAFDLMLSTGWDASVMATQADVVAAASTGAVDVYYATPSGTKTVLPPSYYGVSHGRLFANYDSRATRPVFSVYVTATQGAGTSGGGGTAAGVGNNGTAALHAATPREPLIYVDPESGQILLTPRREHVNMSYSAVFRATDAMCTSVASAAAAAADVATATAAAAAAAAVLYWCNGSNWFAFGFRRLDLACATWGGEA